MNDIIQPWSDDPEFAALPKEQKRRVLSNYFDSQLADEEFKSLDPEKQTKIKDNFFSSTLGKEEPSIAPVEYGKGLISGAIHAPIEYGKGLISGTRHVLPELIGESGQTLGIESAKGLTEWARKGGEPGEHGAFFQAGEMTVPSLGLSLGLRAAAVPAALIPVIGPAIGGGLVVASYILPPAIFALAQYQQTKEAAQEGGVEPGAAPLINATIEFAGETIGNWGFARLLGPGVTSTIKEGAKSVVKATVKRFAKQLPKTLVAEVSTEMGQQYGQAKIEKIYNIRPDADPIKEAMSVVAPTIIMSVVGVGAAHGIQNYQAKKILNCLENSDTDVEKRRAAVMAVAGTISSQEEDPKKPLANLWLHYANNQIDRGLSIDIEKSMSSMTPEEKKVQVAKDREVKTKEFVTGAIDEGLRTGTLEGKPFTPDHVITLIGGGYAQGMFTDEDIQGFKDKYPKLRSYLNEFISENIRKKVEDTVVPYSPELTATLKKAGMALPPGQGFELITPKPETRLRPSPEKIKGPSYPEGAEYVAGKPAPEELEVEHKPILSSMGTPYKDSENARKALTSRKYLTDRDITLATHKVIKVKGGYGIVPIKAKGEWIPGRGKIEEVKGKTLISWVREMGGIKDATLPGEVRALSGKETGVIGLSASKQNKGLSFDEMASAAVEHGWLPKNLENESGAFSELLRDDIFAQKEKGQRVERLTDIAERTGREERWKEFERAEDDELEYFANHPEEEVRADLDKWQRESIEEIRRRNDDRAAREIEESVKSEVEAEDENLGRVKEDEGWQEFSDKWDENEALDEKTLTELEAWREGPKVKPLAEFMPEVAKPKTPSALTGKPESRVEITETPEGKEVPVPVAGEKLEAWQSSDLATKPDIPIGRTEAKKQADGTYKLFFRGTRNEVFEGEKFKSASEAKQFFKVQQVGAQEAIKAKIEPLTETKARLIENIKSEKGSSELINDLSRLGADAIKRGYKTFSAFSIEMKAILGDVWAKVKPLIRRAYFDAKRILKGERGEIGILYRGAKTSEEPAKALEHAKEATFREYGAKIKGNKVILYRGGDIPKSQLRTLRYGDYLSASGKGPDITGNEGADAYGKNVVRLELPLADVEVTGAGEFQYKGKAESLRGGIKYPDAIYKAYNDYYGSNFTAREIDKETNVRTVASLALPGGREEFDALIAKHQVLKEPVAKKTLKEKRAEIKLSVAEELPGKGPAYVRQDGRLSIPEAQKEISKRIGDKALNALTKSGKVNFVTLDEAKTMTGRKMTGVQGFYLNNSTYLIPENINKGKAWSVLLHELGVHHGYQKIFGAKFAHEIFATFASENGKQTSLGKAVSRAMRKVPYGTRPDYINEEAVAYFVEENANRELPLYKKIIARVRLWAIKYLGVRPSVFSEDDYIAIAVAAIHKEAAISKKEIAEHKPVSRELFYSVPAWHGGPHAFEKFKTEKIGAGEGAQAFGWGLYFTDLKKVAENYAEMVKDKFLLFNGKQISYDDFSDQIVKEYGKQYLDLANQISYDFRSHYTLDQILNNIRNYKGKDIDIARDIISRMEGVSVTDVNRWAVRPVGGIYVENKMTQEERTALFDIQGRAGWYSQNVKNPISKVKEELERTVEAQTERIEAGRNKEEARGIRHEAIIGLKVIEKYNLKATFSEEMRNIYKVTLHKGKEPSGYKWLEWDEPVSESLINKIEAQAKKEGLPLGDKHAQEEVYKAENGNILYRELSERLGSDKEASLFLLRAGIDGVKYPTGTLTGTRQAGAFNYVVFDEEAVTIDEHIRYSKAEQQDLKTWADDFLKKAKEHGVDMDKSDPSPERLRETSMSAISGLDMNKMSKTARSFIEGMSPKGKGYGQIIEKWLASPEWYQHPVLKKIVGCTLDKSEKFHNLFNEFNTVDDPMAKHDTVAKTLEALARKGKISKAAFIMGRTSSDFKKLETILDDADVYEEKLTPEKLREKGYSEDIINAWTVVRESYDKQLEARLKPMKDLVARIKERAAFEGKEPVYPDFGEYIIDGKKRRLNLKEAILTMGQLKGFYSPRIRNRGDWVVTGMKPGTVSEGGGEYFRDNRRTKSFANLLKDKLSEQGFTDVKVERASRLPEETFQAVRLAEMGTVIGEATKKGLDKYDPEMQMAFMDEVIMAASDMLKSRGSRAIMIRRQKGPAVKGYITNPLIRYIRYTSNNAAGIAKSEMAEKMIKSLYGEFVNGKKVGGIDTAKEGDIHSLARAYIEEQLRNVEAGDRIVGTIKALTTLKYLGFNTRTILVNVSALTTSAPMAIHTYVMKGKGSLLKVGKYLSLGCKDYTKIMTGKRLSNVDEQTFMDSFRAGGYTDAQYTRDAIGNVSGAYGTAWSKLMSGSMYVFGKSEEWIRGGTALASYRLARSLGQSHTEANDTAIKATAKAHGTYGKETLPMVAWGKGVGRLGQAFYTYLKFPHNYLQMLYDIGVRKHNIKGVIFGMAAPAVLGGVAAVPMYSTVMAIANALMSLIDDDRDAEKLVYDTLNEYMGTEGEKAVRGGVLGLVDVDISGSLSMGPGAIPTSLFELTGALGGMIKDIGAGAKYAISGEYGRAAEKVLPTFAGKIVSAVRELEEGATTSRGDRIWDEQGNPYVPTTAETAKKMLGFRSARAAQLAQTTWVSKREEGRFSDTRSEIYKKVKFWTTKVEDVKLKQDIADKISDYNQNALKTSNVPLITPKSIEAQMAKMEAPTAQKRARSMRLERATTFEGDIWADALGVIERPDKTQSEVKRLSDLGLLTYSAPPSRTIDMGQYHEDVILDEDQYSRYVNDTSKVIKDTVDAYVEGPKWDQWTDREKAFAVRRIINKMRESVRDQLKRSIRYSGR